MCTAFRTAFLSALTRCLRFPAQDLSISRQFSFLKIALFFQFHHHWRSRFHRLQSYIGVQEKFPDTRLTVIDDFRSGNFKNLAGYRGDFVAQNLATLDWGEQFGDEKFEGIV